MDKETKSRINSVMQKGKQPKTEVEVEKKKPPTDVVITTETDVNAAKGKTAIVDAKKKDKSFTSSYSVSEKEVLATSLAATRSIYISSSLFPPSISGADGADGVDGVDGQDGQDGADGITPNIEVGTVETLDSTESAYVNKNAASTDSNAIFDFGIPKGADGTGSGSGSGADGADGQDGADGADGKSAYEIAVEEGFVGTVLEWLASLNGQDGADGADGTNGTDGQDGLNGTDGITPSISIGTVETLVSGTSAYVVLDDTSTDEEPVFNFGIPKGADGTGGSEGGGTNGQDGADGADGKSAYELAVDGGFVGTVEEWLDTLQGADGQDGADGSNGTDGTDGADGSDGKSAYEVAVDEGFVGDEAAWLASLKGDTGEGGFTLKPADLTSTSYLVAMATGSATLGNLLLNDIYTLITDIEKYPDLNNDPMFTMLGAADNRRWVSSDLTRYFYISATFPNTIIINTGSKGNAVCVLECDEWVNQLTGETYLSARGKDEGAKGESGWDGYLHTDNVLTEGTANIIPYAQIAEEYLENTKEGLSNVEYFNNSTAVATKTGKTRVNEEDSTQIWEEWVIVSPVDGLSWEVGKNINICSYSNLNDKPIYFSNVCCNVCTTSTPPVYGNYPDLRVAIANGFLAIAIPVGESAVNKSLSFTIHCYIPKGEEFTPITI